MLVPELTNREWVNILMSNVILSIENRLQIAKQLDPETRGELACYMPELKPEQRFLLAEGASPNWKGRVACSQFENNLSLNHRIALIKQSTLHWKKTFVWMIFWDELTEEQIAEIIE